MSQPEVIQQSSILCLATTWTGANGGHTINRRLSEALARLGHPVFVRVAEDVFESTATHPNLTVGGLKPIPGIDLKERANLLRTEGLPDQVSLIFGHGRFTSGAAQYLQQNQFPNAKTIHVVHALVGSLDISRTQFGTSEQKAEGIRESSAHERTELALVQNSDLVIGVGPLLTEYAESLAKQCASRPNVCELIPGIDIHPQPTWAPNRQKVNLLLFGRTDDPIKGAEIAAGAVKELHRRGYTNVSLTLRGAKPETIPRATRIMSQLAGSPVDIRPFTTNPAELASDIRNADIVLMPSRNEGFGLVAVEAAGHGVPVLVSGCSGVGKFFQDAGHFPGKIATSSVVPMRGNESADALIPGWANQLENMIKNLPTTRTIASGIQHRMAQNFSWDAAAKRLMPVLSAMVPTTGKSINPVALGFPTTTKISRSQVSTVTKKSDRSSSLDHEKKGHDPSR